MVEFLQRPTLLQCKCTILTTAAEKLQQNQHYGEERHCQTEFLECNQAKANFCTMPTKKSWKII